MNNAIQELHSLLAYKEGYAQKFDIAPPRPCAGHDYRAWFNGTIWVPFGVKFNAQYALDDFNKHLFELEGHDKGWDNIQGLRWQHARRAYLDYNHVLIVKHDGTDRKYASGMWIVGEHGEAMRPEVNDVAAVLQQVLYQKRHFHRVGDVDISEEIIRAD